jgi:electron transfer flavoprotein alpha/beta subunit
MYVGRINGDVWEMDEDGGLPDVVAALAPTQVSQPGPTQQDAKNRVIRKISQEAANDIITKLRNKEGI